MKIKLCITIDERIVKEAKDKKLNISLECERALKLKLMAKKSDCPEEAIFLKCFYCKGMFEDGYLCDLTKKFMCINCEPKHKCLNKDHFHIRVPGLNGENIGIMQNYAVEGSIEQIGVEIKETAIKEPIEIGDLQ
jgi:hypothetical protein